MIKINIQGSAAKFALEVKLEDTVESVKGKIIEQSADKPVLDQLRLIYSGQILKNEKSLAEYNIKDGHTLHLVKRATAAAPTQPQTTPNQPQLTTTNTTPSATTMPPLSTFTGNMNAQH